MGTAVDYSSLSLSKPRLQQNGSVSQRVHCRCNPSPVRDYCPLRKQWIWLTFSYILRISDHQGAILVWVGGGGGETNPHLGIAYLICFISYQIPPLKMLESYHIMRLQRGVRGNPGEGMVGHSTFRSLN